MIDITKCDGVINKNKNTMCPIRNNCYRFTAPSDEHWQSVFTQAPGKIVDSKIECAHYWDIKER